MKSVEKIEENTISIELSPSENVHQPSVNRRQTTESSTLGKNFREASASQFSTSTQIEALSLPRPHQNDRASDLLSPPKPYLLGTLTVILPSNDNLLPVEKYFSENSKIALRSPDSPAPMEIKRIAGVSGRCTLTHLLQTLAGHLKSEELIQVSLETRIIAHICSTKIKDLFLQPTSHSSSRTPWKIIYTPEQTLEPKMWILSTSVGSLIHWSQRLPEQNFSNFLLPRSSSGECSKFEKTLVQMSNRLVAEKYSSYYSKKILNMVKSHLPNFPKESQLLLNLVKRTSQKMSDHHCRNGESPKSVYSRARYGRSYGIAHKLVMWKEASNQHLNAIGEFRPQARVILDAGAGPGFMSYQLQKKFPKATVFLQDKEPDMIRWAQKTMFPQHDRFNCNHFAHTRIATGDITKNLFLGDKIEAEPNSVDAIVSHSVIWNFPKQAVVRQFLKLSFEKLAPGGILSLMSICQLNSFSIRCFLQQLNSELKSLSIPTTLKKEFLHHHSYLLKKLSQRLDYGEIDVRAWLRHAGFEVINTDSSYHYLGPTEKECHLLYHFVAKKPCSGNIGEF